SGIGASVALYGRDGARLSAAPGVWPATSSSDDDVRVDQWRPHGVALAGVAVRLPATADLRRFAAVGPGALGVVLVAVAAVIGLGVRLARRLSRQVDVGVATSRAPAGGHRHARAPGA